MDREVLFLMARLCVALLLAAALAGCGAGRRDQPIPPAAPLTAPATVPATLSPNSTLTSALPRPIGTEGAYQVFEVSPQQYEIIGRRVAEVIVRQKLWDQGVRFGAGVDPDTDMHFVLINPGLSGLTARQILDRLLGNP